MKIKNYYRLFLALCVVLTSVVAANKPNVILMVSDDQGYGDVSAHGSPVLKTRGGFVLDLEWKDAQWQRASVTALQGGPFRLKAPAGKGWKTHSV